MRVAIAEDSVLLRKGLTLLLEEAGHEVVTAAGDAEAFLRAVRESRPDACVVDDALAQSGSSPHVINATSGGGDITLRRD